jgi:chromosome partitioning protein
MPVQPSPFDIWATEDTVQLIREAQIFKPSLTAAFAVNRKIANTAIGRDVLEAFAEADFPVLKAQVCQRVLYAESAMVGLSVVEAAPYGDAAREIRRLATEIRGFGQGERKAA